MNKAQLEELKKRMIERIRMLTPDVVNVAFEQNGTIELFQENDYSLILRVK